MRDSDEYVLRTWEIEDGLPTNTVNSMAQTPDGYLWLATPAGLVRFDGVRFTLIATDSAGELASNPVQTVFSSKGGTLWIAYGKGGVSCIRKGEFDRILPENTRADTSVWVTSFAEDANGAIWFGSIPETKVWRWMDGTLTGSLEKDARVGNAPYVHASAAGKIWLAGTKGCGFFDGQQFRPVDPKGGNWVRLAPARSGGMWSGRAETLVRYHEDGTRHELAPLASLGVSPKVTALHEDSDGNLWIGTLDSGLFRCRDGSAEAVPTSHTSVTSIFEDRERNLWVGTRGGGLNRLRRAPFSMRKLEHGLSHDAISVVEDTSERLWVVGSAATLTRSLDATKRRFAAQELRPALSIMALCADHDGTVWMATLGGLARWKDGIVTREPFDEGLTALLLDSRGDLWMASIPSGLFRRRSGTIEPIPATNGLTKPRALAEEPGGRIWVGTENGQVFRQNDDGFAPVPLPGEHNAQIRFIVPDGVNVWIGAFQGGLYRWRAGRVTHLPHGEGLPTEDLRSLTIGASGDFWIGTLRGLFRASRENLEAVMDGRQATLDCASYTRNDGMPNTDFALGFRSGTTRTRDGRLWFATTGGALEVDVERLRQNVAPPPLLIEEIQVGGVWRRVNGTEKPVLPPNSGPIQIRYTLAQLTMPEHVRFRYRLASTGGEEWFSADAQRTATFTHLPPGDYRFEVGASFAGGPWLAETASLNLTVRAAWWETIWFRLGIALAGAATLIALVLFLARRRMRARLRRLEQAHALERERARIARDMHDEVGASLTQIAIASQLARLEPADAPAHVDEIAAIARRTVTSLDEIVWAINPRHDTLAALLEYLGQYAIDFLSAAGIRCDLDIPEAVPASPFDSKVRHHLFLSVKEALNNIVKHARATSVHLSVTLTSASTRITITDDGCGFEPGSGSAGSDGLTNIGERLTELGGTCQIESKPGEGTHLVLELPLKRAMAHGTAASP